MPIKNFTSIITSINKVLIMALFIFFNWHTPSIAQSISLDLKTTPNVDFVFNSYLQFIFGVGLLGAVWIGYAIKYFKENFTVNRESLAVLSVCILSCFEYVFEIPRLWFTIIFIFGTFVIKQREALHVSSQ